MGKDSKAKVVVTNYEDNTLVCRVKAIESEFDSGSIRTEHYPGHPPEWTYFIDIEGVIYNTTQIDWESVTDKFIEEVTEDNLTCLSDLANLTNIEVETVPYDDLSGDLTDVEIDTLTYENELRFSISADYTVSISAWKSRF